MKILVWEVYSMLSLILGTFLISFLFTYIAIKISHKFKLYDKVEERKVHSGNIPRIGGISIFLSLAFGIVLSEIFLSKIVFARPHNLKMLFIYLFSMAVIFALGLVDDIKGLGAYSKFPVEFAVALLLYFYGFKIEFLSLPWGGNIKLGIFAPVITMLWIVGVMNAINLIDGLDGLAAGISIFASTSMLAIFLLKARLEFAAVIAGLIGALLGFIPYNLNPARIFLGDCGSLTIGFILATFALKSSEKANLAISLSVAVIILFIPILDTLFAIYRRVRKKAPIFSADNDHIHHRLLRKLGSHRLASFVLIGLSALFSFTGVFISFSGGTARIIVLISALVFALIFLFLLGYSRPSSVPTPGQEKLSSNK